MLQSVTNGNEDVTIRDIMVNRGDTVRLSNSATVTRDKIPVVCVRSFFNGTISRQHKKQRIWTMAAVTLAMLLILTAVLFNTQAGFAVYFNGEQIGRVESMEEVSNVVTIAEEQLKEIFGREYSLGHSISVSPNLGVKADDTEEMKNAILGRTDGITQLYVLEVGGTPVGASDEKSALDGILEGILNEYATALTSSIRFTDDVTISHRFINNDITQDTAAIRAMLEPSNSASKYKLTVESVEQKQYTEEIACDVRYYYDDTIYEGSSKVKTKGVPGEALVAENIIFVNGVRQSSQVVSKTVVRAPVTEVVAVGTAPRPKTASWGSYIWPTEGVITSYFGPRTGFGSKNHQGIDIAGAYGEQITAADGGEVIKSGWFSGYGLLVGIRHDNGDVTYYGHCSELLVKEGDRVCQGQVIAYMGATGVASGVHLHFEIRKNDEPVDPIDYLP
jgi:murein DD-endopeptidase MepM/ murein hydrolase activator NlpD